MTLSGHPNPRFSPRRASLLLLLALLPALNGCFVTRTVNKVTVAPHLMDATLDQLLVRIGTQYQAVQTFTAKVDINSSTGGSHTGKVTENPQLAGYIILRKPLDLRVLMLKPVIGSRAIDMVSDGKTFKLFFSTGIKTGGYEGPDGMTKSTKTGLESLRPNIIREALQVPPIQPDEFIEETSDSRIVTPAHGKVDAVEEPDYDIAFLHTLGDHHLERVRVVHISRTTLLPYRQDIYQDGRIVTQVDYDKYQRFGEVDFPMSISIRRPVDEYELKITVNKLTLNEKVDDEQFVLKFPEGLVVQKMQ